MASRLGIDDDASITNVDALEADCCEYGDQTHWRPLNVGAGSSIQPGMDLALSSPPLQALLGRAGVEPEVLRGRRSAGETIAMELEEQDDLLEEDEAVEADGPEASGQTVPSWRLISYLFCSTDEQASGQWTAE